MKITMIFLFALLSSLIASAQSAGSGGGGDRPRILNISAVLTCEEGSKALFQELGAGSRMVEVWRTCRDGRFYPKAEVVILKCQEGRIEPFTQVVLSGRSETTYRVCRGGRFIYYPGLRP